MQASVLHHYKKFRTHQLATWDRSDNSGGGAWPGEHAAVALRSARAHVHFLKRLKGYCQPSRKRGKQ